MNYIATTKYIYIYIHTMHRINHSLNTIHHNSLQLFNRHARDSDRTRSPELPSSVCTNFSMNRGTSIGSQLSAGRRRSCHPRNPQLEWSGVAARSSREFMKAVGWFAPTRVPPVAVVKYGTHAWFVSRLIMQPGVRD